VCAATDNQPRRCQGLHFGIEIFGFTSFQGWLLTVESRTVRRFWLVDRYKCWSSRAQSSATLIRLMDTVGLSIRLQIGPTPALRCRTIDSIW
jgi:hypothetical protein